MATELFSDKNQEQAFYNLRAEQTLKTIIIEQAEYNNEIIAALEKCGDIFLKHGAKLNYFAEIDNIENDLRVVADQDKEELIIRKAVLIKEYNEFLQSLPRVIGEDLEFYANQISDRRNRFESDLNRQKAILEAFPEAKNLDVKKAINNLNSVFKVITDYTKEPLVDNKDFLSLQPANNMLETVTITSNQEIKSPMINSENHRRVVGIKKAPQELLNKLYPPTKVESEDVSESELIPFIFDENQDFALDFLPDVEVREQQEIQEELEDDKFYYVVQLGQSLADIALAICGDVDGWIDIYCKNKKIIDQTLIEKHYNKFNEFETDQDLFAGLKIEIPTVFNKNADCLGS